jgi:protein SCO1/2
VQIQHGGALLAARILASVLFGASLGVVGPQLAVGAAPATRQAPVAASDTTATVPATVAVASPTAAASPAARPAAPPTAASISGHFVLDTPDGRTVTDATYRGKWLVVYFGYTSCPDICPTVILRIGQALNSLGSTADRIQPIFITVDPARDTPKHLAQYMAAFNPRVIGLRGDAGATREAAKQFHVYYRTRSLGNDEYTVDHSSFLYVIDPKGQFTKLLADTLSADQLAAEFRTLAGQEQTAKAHR